MFANRASGVNWSEKAVTVYVQRMKIRGGELRFLPKYLERGPCFLEKNLKAGYTSQRFIAFLLTMFLNIYLKGPMSYPRYSPHNKSQRSNQYHRFEKIQNKYFIGTICLYCELFELLDLMPTIRIY